MQQYTVIITLKITKIQKQTLGKLKQRNIRVSDFIRKAIEKLIIKIVK